MIIYDWDIWYTYSSFLDEPQIDLHSAGLALVKSGVASCALHKDGQTWWKVKDKVCSGVTHFDLNPRKSGAEISLEVDGGDHFNLEGYTAEAWYQASHFRFNELRLFEDDPLPPPYIRIILDEFHLTSSEEDFKVVLYPVVKLFENGVILVQFRAIAPNREISLDEFIYRHVNLGNVSFSEVEASPSICVLAPKAYNASSVYWSPKRRYSLLKAEYDHTKAIASITRNVKSGDFNVRLAPLTRDNNKGDTLASVAQTIYSIIGYVLSEPRGSVEFLFRGHKEIIPAGNYWSGRPHIYILDFKEQKYSASENLETFKNEFGCILARTPSNALGDGARYLTNDMRLFNDYSTFVSQACQ